MPQYDLTYFYVYLNEYEENKNYTKEDFDQIDLNNLIEVNNPKEHYLLFELRSNEYYSFIKTIDKISRSSNVEKVITLSQSVPIKPIWELRNNDVVEILPIYSIDNYKIVIEGKKAGKVSLNYDGISIEITVNE